ncbi:hypothetical protein M9Y10_029866 [Tritrichomonas musculus]|uniref:Protein kinase domain-containing protein n=1 Tax=Tritrichomonas musculus TaxID=1915356 RepID=A0ABR2KNA5_9EUKA
MSYNNNPFKPSPILNVISSNTNILICIEKECLIIENINISLVAKIINNLRENRNSVIDASENCQNSDEENTKIKDELLNFGNNITKDLKKNEFVTYTFRPIAIFLIWRYFYPTQYFKDPSFFNINQPNKLNEELILKNKIWNYLFTKEDDPKLDEILNELQLINIEKNQDNILIFSSKDFIKLRLVYQNIQSDFHLVIHRESLYIYLMKSIKYNGDCQHENENEINFCSQYSNRCLTHFYGFVKEKDEIIGIIYEFMCRDNLDLFVRKNPSSINKIYSLTAIIRIFQGMNYIHSNSLINRDLKPANVLLDNNYLPYLIFYFHFLRAFFWLICLYFL